MTKKEVAISNNEVLAEVSAEMPDWMKGMEDDDSGNEHVQKEDLVIPRLNIIQAISPQLDKKDPLYIPGAENGMMFNSLTKELMGSLLVVSIMFEKPFLIWRDRKKGGGFGGQFPTVEDAEDAISSKEDAGDWLVTDTPTNLCLAIPESGRAYEIAIPMSKSKAKVARNWNSIIRLAGGPRFARVYKISVVDDKNTAGEKFKNFQVDFHGFAGEHLFKKCKEIYELVSSGEVKYAADYSDESSPDENSPYGKNHNPSF